MSACTWIYQTPPGCTGTPRQMFDVSRCTHLQALSTGPFGPPLPALVATTAALPLIPSLERVSDTLRWWRRLGRPLLLLHNCWVSGHACTPLCLPGWHLLLWLAGSRHLTSPGRLGFHQTLGRPVSHFAAGLLGGQDVSCSALGGQRKSTCNREDQHPLKLQDTPRCAVSHVLAFTLCGQHAGGSILGAQRGFRAAPACQQPSADDSLAPSGRSTAGSMQWGATPQDPLNNSDWHP